MITTGYGDKGQTDIKGARVRKDDIIIETLGSLDEAAAAISLAYAFEVYEEEKCLFDVIYNIYEISAIVAGYEHEGLSYKFRDLTQLENFIESVPYMDRFTIGYKNLLGAKYNWARVMVRKAERQVIKLFNETDISISDETKEDIVRYLNRVSDFLFALAETR